MEEVCVPVSLRPNEQYQDDIKNYTLSIPCGELFFRALSTTVILK
jgi:hypothetical protein